MKGRDMASQRTGLLVASIVFALVCIAQLARLALQPEVLVAGHLLPLWPSAIAAIVAGGLSYWLWRLAALRTS
jgi:hypothetical protein